MAPLSELVTIWVRVPADHQNPKYSIDIQASLI